MASLGLNELKDEMAINQRMHEWYIHFMKQIPISQSIQNHNYTVINR